MNDMATPTSPGNVVNTTLSGQLPIDNLLASKKWASNNLTYSFGEYGTSYYLQTYGAYNEPWNGFQPLTAVQRNATTNALANFAEISNLNFTRVTDSQTVAGDLRYAQTAASSTAHAYFPAASTTAGDAWFGTSSGSYNSDVKGSYSYATFMHETGHALGLEHPHTKNNNPTQDYTLYSVMSYRSYEGASVTGGYTQSFFPTTLMMNDISAIQHMYGADYSTRSGDTRYSWAPGKQLLETIWDGGGNDTISWSGQTSKAEINLNAGQFSKLGPAYYTGKPGDLYEERTLGIARNVTIENAEGGDAADIITGNSANNKLYGRKGADTIKGGDGNDFLNGQQDKDFLTGGNGADKFYFYNPTEGGDIITDYNIADVIEVFGTGFGLTSGRYVTSSEFNLGSSALDSSDRFMYDKAGSGGLFFDKDGTGLSAKVLLADLASGLSFNQGEIYLSSVG